MKHAIILLIVALCFGDQCIRTETLDLAEMSYVGAMSNLSVGSAVFTALADDCVAVDTVFVQQYDGSDFRWLFMLTNSISMFTGVIIGFFAFLICSRMEWR